MASFDENGKYIKTNWKAGDKITATKLNKIEESIETVNDNDISRHVEADARLDALEAKDVAHDKEFTKIKNTIADNKAAAELGDYEINSRMTFLEEELNEGIEEVRNVASTVDGKIATAEANMTAQVNMATANMTTQVNTATANMTAQVNTAKEEMTTQVNTATANMTAQVNQGKADMTAQVNTAKDEMTAQVNQGKADMEAMVAEVESEMIEIQNDIQSNYLPLSGGAITGGINICNEDYRLSLANNHLVCETDPLYLRGGTEYSGIWINSNDKTIYPNRSKGEWILGTDDDKWYNIYCHNSIKFSSDCSIGVGSGNMFFALHGGTRQIYFQDDASSNGPIFRPTGHDIHLGHKSHRWNTLYLVNNPDVSSDRVMKENIEYVGKAKSGLTYEEMYNFVKNDLGLATYNFIGDDKLRMNFIAQDLLANEDGSDNKIGQMIVNPVAVPSEEEIAEGKPYPTLSYDTGMYTSVLAGALKEAINKIEQLEARINELENK